jgi:hypothetical protein
MLPHLGHDAISRNRSGSLMSGPYSVAVRSRPCSPTHPIVRRFILVGVARLTVGERTLCQTQSHSKRWETTMSAGWIGLGIMLATGLIWAIAVITEFIPIAWL